METATLFEWGVGGIFVGVNAYRRYNTPSSNRESTTFQNFSTYFFFYLLCVLALYVFFGAVFYSSPETVGQLYGVLIGNPDAALPSQLANLSAPMVSALFFTTLLPSLPYLSRYDQALLNTFWDRGHIPHHVQKMAAAMRRAPFNFSPRQTKQLRNLCKTLQLEFHALELQAGINLDYRWARSNALIDSIDEWHQDDNGRLRRYMQSHEDEWDKLTEQRDEINNEYRDLKTEPLEEHVRAKMERFLDKSISSFFRDVTVFVAKATCSAELSESGRRSRVSQLGFEGGTIGYEGLSGRQIAGALIAIFLAFLVLAVAQELPKDLQERKFRNVFFLTFLMLFTYGAALIIALDLKRRVGMGYNELTRQRSWSAYVAVGVITALSWLFVSFSYRYIVSMLQGAESDENMEKVLTSIKWSYPYALQSLALAVSISWILDYHQSHGMSGRLKLSQRFFDVGVSVAALGIASVIAYCWMDGKGWFEGSATRGPQWIAKNPLSAEWLVIRGMAVAAVVGWLVPMWFYINRSKAPDQIAGRLITMNKKGLAAEIRNLTPDELIRAIAAVAASIAAIDNDVNRNERDVYQIICGHLAGLPNSDVDIDSAEKEFDHCIDLIEREELQLEERLEGFRHLPLLSSLMPFVASSVAFADGVYLQQEQEIVNMIQNRCA